MVALSCCPQYLLLDEAFDGLDPVIRLLIKKLLAQQIADRDMTVVITSHNLRELEDLCDHIGLLHKGSVLFEQELDELKFGLCKIQAVFREKIDWSRSGLELILGIGFVCMPLQYLLGAFSYDELDPAYSMSGVFGLGGLFTWTSIYLVPLLWVAAAAVVGLSQTAYMQNRRAVDVYHSLPLTRKQLLCAHYIAAFFTVALPMALNYGATLLLSAVRQMRFPTAEFAPGAAGFGLALWLVSLAGMLSVAFLVSTQTGSVFDTLIFAGVLLCAPLFLSLVHEMMCNEFLYGHVTGLPLIVVARFSPLTLGLTDFATVFFLGTDSAVQLPWWLCPLWAVLSAAILAAACALYVRRPSERAEAPSRTGLLALIIRVLAMLILCPTGGYVFACSIRSVPTLGMLLLGTAVCGIFGFFILETILNRGAKGLFKAFPLGLALTAVVTGYMAARRRHDR